MSDRVWFITGASRGFGRVWADAALKRGDKVAATAITGFYHASKWAFEALHESLAQEVRAFGVKVTLLEPGAYATAFASQTSLKLAAGVDAYADLKRQVFASSANIDFGDPWAT